MNTFEEAEKLIAELETKTEKAGVEELKNVEVAVNHLVETVKLPAEIKGEAKRKPSDALMIKFDESLRQLREAIKYYEEPVKVIISVEEQNARREKAKIAYTESIDKRIEEMNQLSIERRQKYLESGKSKIEIAQLMLEYMCEEWTQRTETFEELLRNWQRN